MGSGESTTRKVSFGVDDEDRVRILRGVKLSEDVLQRMRGVANIAPGRTSSTSTSSQKDTGASPSTSSGPQHSPQHRTPPSAQSNTPKQDAYAKEEQRRFERQQALMKEELSKAVQRDRDAAAVTKALNRERQQARRESEQAKALSADDLDDMAQQLQKKDSQLKALDAFYKAQLAQLEKRNREQYEQSKEQFHRAATKTEETVRPRSVDPVCPGLQAQILSCYKENSDQTLRCSDLAKEYMRCIDAAKKNSLVNHG